MELGRWFGKKKAGQVGWAEPTSASVVGRQQLEANGAKRQNSWQTRQEEQRAHAAFSPIRKYFSHLAKLGLLACWRLELHVRARCLLGGLVRASHLRKPRHVGQVPLAANSATGQCAIFKTYRT